MSHKPDVAGEPPSIDELGMGDVAYGLARRAIDCKWDASKLGPAIALFADDLSRERAALRSAAGPAADFDSRLAAVKALSFLGIVAKDSEIAALQGLFHGAFVAGTEAAKEHLARAAGPTDCSIPEKVGDKFVVRNGEMRFMAQALSRLDDIPGSAAQRGWYWWGS
jgi:hypothetical protein